MDLIIQNLEKYLDNKWNSTIPKIIDNSIIYIMFRKKYQEEDVKKCEKKLIIEKFSLPPEIVNILSNELKSKILEEQKAFPLSFKE